MYSLAKAATEHIFWRRWTANDYEDKWFYRTDCGNV